ncbi:MAG: LacI family DNA-binding transcriptional regulator [Mycobacteriales bacterium]
MTSRLARVDRRPTMVDVAREAGVALRTVSRVVNGESNVNPELAQRVRAVIETLGYRPDERARQLRSGSSGTIGAAVRGVGGVWQRAAERAAREASLMLLSASTEDDEELYGRVIELLCRRRVDGLIVEAIGAPTPYLKAEVAAGLPVVAVDRRMSDIDTDSVLSDSESGIQSAFAYLADRGHRRIAYVGDSERISTGRARAEAMRACIRSAGRHSPADLVRTGDIDQSFVGSALDALLSAAQPPTALITGNFMATRHVLRHLGSGIEQIALIGFDDIDNVDLMQTPVTVVAQDWDAIGRTAMELLTTRIANPDAPRVHRVLPVELIVRHSSEVPAPAR